MRDMIKKMTGRRQTKYKRLSQRCVNNKKGVSLVGVIVAFLLLMIIMLMFQKSLKVSGNLIARSVDIRKEEQELIGDYYKNRTSPTNTESVSCVFSGEDGSFTLNTKWYPSAHGYEPDPLSLWIFGDGTTGYENRSSAMSDGGDEQ